MCSGEQKILDTVHSYEKREMVGKCEGEIGENMKTMLGLSFYFDFHHVLHYISSR